MFNNLFIQLIIFICKLNYKFIKPRHRNIYTIKRNISELIFTDVLEFGKKLLHRSIPLLFCYGNNFDENGGKLPEIKFTCMF